MLGLAVRRRVPAAALALVLLGLARPALGGIVVAREFKSAVLDRSWTYSVYLPTGYDTSNLRYPALYLLHGSGGNLYQWVNQGRIQQTADALMATGDIPPAVIVMPDGGTSWFVDRKEKMETAIITELIPEVEKTFRVLRSREGRVIGGLSMGGYGAMRFALRYPEMFAAAALLSPAIYNPEPPENSVARTAGVFGAPAYDAAVWKSLNYPALWEGYLAKRSPVPMYINSGDDDELFTEFEAAQFYELLRKNKQPAELRIVNGAHAWPVWESTIGDALKYIFRYCARPAMTSPSR
jgi:enterochelin esterase-like enzyme